MGASTANPAQVFLVTSFTGLPLHIKLQCLVCKAMQLRGYTPVILTYSKARYARRYFEMFGIREVVNWDEYVGRTTLDSPEVQNVASELLHTNTTVESLLECLYRDVYVGRHALSRTARHLIDGRLDLRDTHTAEILREQLGKAVQSVIVSHRLFRDYPVRQMLVRDSGYTPNGGIFETGMLHGLEPVVYEQAQQRGCWVFKRYTPRTRGQHYFSLAAETWERIAQSPWLPENDERLEHEFAARYRPDSVSDTRRLMVNKKNLEPEEVRARLNLDPSKKTAVVFSHIGWDAAYFYGTCLFNSFEDWLVETVKFVARECSQLNWIIKLHPFNVFKLQFEGRTEESELRLLRGLMPLPDHIKIVRANTEVNTFSLFPVVDYALTVNGTVGMEFPCFGVPAILAGTGRYDGRGFTIEPRTREEYFSVLKDIHRIPRLEAQAQQLARKHYYGLIVGRQFSLEDIAPMRLVRQHEAQSGVYDDISIRARSLQEFQAAKSIRILGDWFAYSHDPDLFVLPE